MTGLFEDAAEKFKRVRPPSIHKEITSHGKPALAESDLPAWREQPIVTRSAATVESLRFVWHPWRMQPATGRCPVIVLHTPLVDPARLNPFVQDCLREGVKLIAIAGPDAAMIEDMIDEIVVGDGSREDRFVLTSSHADEPVVEVISFAASWDGGAEVRQVRL